MTHYLPRPALATAALTFALAGLVLMPDLAHAAASTGSDSGGFLGIAQSLEDQGSQIAKVIGALLLIGTIFFGWLQNSMKIVGVGVVMAIIASFAISGQLWKAGQSTADRVGGGQVQQR